MFGIIAVVGLLFASCGEDDDNNNNNNNNSQASGLPEVKAAGQQVYTMSWNNETPVYTEFKGNVALNQPSFAPATIVNGMLSYSFGTPPTGVLEPITGIFDQDFADMHNNFTISPNDASIALFWGFSNPAGYGLTREFFSYSGSSSGYTETWGGVSFLYVDRDVTIKGTGKTVRDDTYPGEYGSPTEIYIFRTTNINLELKRGWNILRQDNVKVFSIPAQNTHRYEDTLSLSIDNPASFRWVLYIPQNN
jgi:hypothetical protein